MPTNDPFMYKIEPAEPGGDERHARIVVRSTFNAAAPYTGSATDARAGLRAVAGILGRLAAYHHDAYSGYRRHLVVADERTDHECGKDSVRCRVRGRGLIDPYTTLRAESDPYGPLGVPTVEFVVPAERAAAWREALRETLAKIARIDEWIPTDEQRHQRVFVYQDSAGGACAPDAILVGDGFDDDDSDHYAFSVDSPDTCLLDSSIAPTVAMVATAAAVYASRRETSRRIGRLVGEMAGEVDQVRVRHGCVPKWAKVGYGCTITADEVIRAIDPDDQTYFCDDPTSVCFRAPTEAQGRAMAGMVRTLLASMDKVDR